MHARPQTVQWLERYYELLDSGRLRDAMSEFLAEDCTFRLGNGEPVSFLEEARVLSKLVKGVRHRILTVLEDGDGMLACELEVTYIRHTGTSVTLPGALFARVLDGHFVEQRAYIDHSPLM